MATTGANIWTNKDGLRVRFGTSQAAIAREGSPTQAGTFKTMEIDLEFQDFAAFGTTKFANGVPTVALPQGWLLRSAILHVVVPFASGGAATLSIGTATQSGTDVNTAGIISASALATINTVGAQVTAAGAQIGTLLASDQYISVTVGTANYTAGKAKLVITMMPTGDL